MALPSIRVFEVAIRVDYAADPTGDTVYTGEIAVAYPAAAYLAAPFVGVVVGQVPAGRPAAARVDVLATGDVFNGQIPVPLPVVAKVKVRGDG